MKRFDTEATALRQAQRVVDPVSGDLLDAAPTNAPARPVVDWPLVPTLRRALARAFTARDETSDAVVQPEVERRAHA